MLTQPSADLQSMIHKHIDVEFGPVICQITTYNNGLFVFVALCPMSTTMVIAGRSVHLTTLFPGQA